MTKLDSTTRTSSGFQLKFGIPTQVRDSNTGSGFQLKFGIPTQVRDSNPVMTQSGK